MRRPAERIIVSLALLVASIVLVQQLGGPTRASALSPALQQQLAATSAGQMVTVVVRLRDRVDVRARRTGPVGQRLHGVGTDLRNKQTLSQTLMIALLNLLKAQGRVSSDRKSTRLNSSHG